LQLGNIPFATTWRLLKQEYSCRPQRSLGEK